MIARLLISQSLRVRVGEIKKILESAGITRNHPDLLYFPEGAKLGIEQARIMKAHFFFKPYQSKGRAVVLEDASVLTPEAQNALLKLLEEPPSQAVLILGAPSDAKFLPTILSRCQIIELQGERPKEVDLTLEIEKLLSVKMGERFEYIEKLKDKEQFLSSLTQYFHSKLPKYANFTKELLQAEEWVNQNVNIRAILEYLMLVMPQKL